MVIDNKYEIGQIVYLATDKEQLPMMILSFEVFKDGEIMYKLGTGTTTTYHYDFEFSDKENELIKVK